MMCEKNGPWKLIYACAQIISHEHLFSVTLIRQDQDHIFKPALFYLEQPSFLFTNGANLQHLHHVERGTIVRRYRIVRSEKNRPTDLSTYRVPGSFYRRHRIFIPNRHDLDPGIADLQRQRLAGFCIKSQHVIPIFPFPYRLVLLAVPIDERGSTPPHLYLNR